MNILTLVPLSYGMFFCPGRLGDPLAFRQDAETVFEGREYDEARVAAERGRTSFTDTATYRSFDTDKLQGSFEEIESDMRRHASHTIRSAVPLMAIGVGVKTAVLYSIGATLGVSCWPLWFSPDFCTLGVTCWPSWFRGPCFKYPPI